MTDYDYILEQCGQSNDGLWNTLVKAIPTSRLVKTLYYTCDEYKRIHPQDSFSYSRETFRAAYDSIRDELRRRYMADVDCEVIENAFNHTTPENREWIKCQKKKRKAAEKRYQDPFLERLMDCEVFADKEVVDGGILDMIL